jgi:hypothetical protein
MSVNLGKIFKNMGKFGKNWEYLGIFGKFGSNLGTFKKNWEIWEQISKILEKI